MRGVIYKYTSPSGKSYVGQTINEKLRRKLWNSSKYHYAGAKIDRARAKYGSGNFTYDILFDKEFSTKEIASIWLNIAEQYFIQLYDTVNKGYNCEEGGGGNPNHTGAIHHCRGYKLSEETKRRIGEGAKRWQNTPEGKAKMSAIRKGSVKHKGYRIEANSLAVVQMDLEGRYIREFPSILDAERYVYQGTTLAKTGSNISAVCYGKRDSAKGYKWLFREDYYTYFLHPEAENIPLRVQRALDYIEKRHTSKTNEAKHNKHREGPRINRFAQEAGQYGSDYKLIKVWRCAGDAAEELHIIEANIRRAEKTFGLYQGCYWRKYDGQSVCSPKLQKVIKKPRLNKQIVQKDLNGNIIKIHDSIGQACECLGITSRVCLSKCLNGKAHTAYGYKWEFLNWA